MSRVSPLCGATLVVASLIACSDSAPAPKSVEVVVVPPPPRLVAFVGEQLSLEAPGEVVPHSDGIRPQDGSGCYLDQPMVSARYRVLETIAGEVPQEVEFETVPCLAAEFAHSRWALLYVVMTPEGNWVVPGGADAVFPTHSGSWATCDTDWSAGSARVLLGPVEFSEGLAFGEAGWMSVSGVESQFPADTYSIADGRVFCHRGLSLPTLVNVLDARIAAARSDETWRYPDLLPPE